MLSILLHVVAALVMSGAVLLGVALALLALGVVVLDARCAMCGDRPARVRGFRCAGCGRRRSP